MITWYETIKKETEGASCPFCGSVNLLKIEKTEYGGYAVECQSCQARGPQGALMDEAVKRWNKRNVIPTKCLVCKQSPF